MRLNNNELYEFFIEKNILVLYHANTVSTSVTYFQQNGLLSRGAVENLGLNQTPQSSDEADKILDVWNDVFLDSTDLHAFFSRQNHYGPILFEFDVNLIQDENYEIWITKDNPIYWDSNFTDHQKYFLSVQELRETWDNYARQKKMITIRNNSTPILFDKVRRVIVDDPRVIITNGDIHLHNEAVNKIKSVVGDKHTLKGKFTTRICSNCWCRENYLNEVHVSDLKKIFL
ncbi:hypothetical protein [Flavobacterium terrigena]|uniref:Uncharacterized protein n=1 Tax=Flavobacterium terrigena TaxID=402734 RepID=A0A1H6S4T1_9FLAO|nr:hypothetical protein [Flavobacterium terrigena]SEI62909.1 hypothetical protein SAMN05660918_1206 [Flavobacterium terrigena]